MHRCAMRAADSASASCMIVPVDAFARGEVSRARRRGVAVGARVCSNEGSTL